MSARIAVVTGASGGVGRATAIALADRGFDVALVARGSAGLAAASHDVERAGRRSLVVPADVSQFADVDAAATEVEDRLGPIDVWVNNAMATVFAPVSQLEPDEFRRAVEVTFLGQVWGTMAALHRMRPRDRGAIVNVGSALSFIGIPLQAPYCAAKFACRGFFESARAELLHERSNVRVSMVHLPAVNTPQFDWCRTYLDRRPQPVAPVYQPELAARRIVEIALDGRRADLVGSWNKLLIFAGRLFPGFGNHYAAITAWEGQLGEAPPAPGRRSNLWEPADAEIDHGARGSFDERADGFTDPYFLKSLPRALRDASTAAGRTMAEKVSALRAVAERRR